MTTSEDLIKFAKRNLKNRKFVVAIQREPYAHVMTPEGIKIEKTAGGAHVLLDGILKEIGGLMVAIGSGSADDKIVDQKGRVQIPSPSKNYTLKRVFLKKKEMDGFYYGFANQTLWPLCHAVFVKPVFSKEWWEQYINVNKKFAEAILEELGDQDGMIWINDYHLALLPKLLKEKRPSLSVGTFWHIPWPTYEIFRICPWRKPILEGLLGSDFIGFHRGYHVENFVQCAKRELEIFVDWEPRSIKYKNHEVKLANLPAGIDYHFLTEVFEKTKDVIKNLIKRDFGFDYEKLAIGVDRIDYTKGIPERLKIIDSFLEKYPQFHRKFVYLGLGAPSRTKIPAYKDINQEISELVKKINSKYETKDWKPIHYIVKIFPRQKILAYYRLADVCLITSLDDGMNLVAKEYIICNKPDKGTILLSKFTGAAKDLTSAFLINPYDTDDASRLLYEALNLEPNEKIKRNKQMKEVLKENNIYSWAIEFIKNTLS